LRLLVQLEVSCGYISAIFTVCYFFYKNWFECFLATEHAIALLNDESNL
jgi:hypothetical protein